MKSIAKGDFTSYLSDAGVPKLAHRTIAYCPVTAIESYPIRDTELNVVYIWPSAAACDVLLLWIIKSCSEELDPMEILWEIYKRNNGTYDIFKDGLLLDESVPDAALERQLAAHWITGDDYREVRRQLAETGKAILRSLAPVVTFQQIG